METETKRAIVFTFEDDFAPIIEAAGIDPATVTDAEWQPFANRFLDGIGWAEVAEVAASILADERREKN